jgi:hypothetical protein
MQKLKLNLSFYNARGGTSGIKMHASRKIENKK